MDTIISTETAQIMGGILVGIIAIATGFQKILKSWKATSAESTVITLVHDELERMSVQNVKLTKELNKLQLEIVGLNRELHKLNLENQRLHIEVASLTSEVTRLQNTLLNGMTNEPGQN